VDSRPRVTAVLGLARQMPFAGSISDWAAVVSATAAAIAAIASWLAARRAEERAASGGDGSSARYEQLPDGCHPADDPAVDAASSVDSRRGD
jgi:hypothetical protein